MQGSPPPPAPAAVSRVASGAETLGNEYRRQSGERRPCRLVPLHALSEAHVRLAGQLLGEKWPRAEETRLAQLASSRDELPVSLVLVSDDGEAEELLGHVRLQRCVEDARGVIAESVVVWQRLRGLGYGGLLMRLMHDFARRHGFATVHLCTQDKRAFYEHLGYRLAGPVSPLSSASQLVDKDALSKLKGVFGAGHTQEFVWLALSLS